jgi:hypothetical protein
MCHYPCIVNYSNFGTKFLEGWVYVTTLINYLIIMVVKFNLINY